MDNSGNHENGESVGLEEMMRMMALYREMFGAREAEKADDEPGVSAQGFYGEPVKEPKKEFPPLPFDEKTQSSKMRAVKAVLPYLEPKAGRQLAVMVKIMEIKKIMESFETDIAIQSKKESKSADILNALRPYCDDETSNMLNVIEKAMEMRGLMRNIENR